MNPATAAILSHAFCSPREARVILRMGRNAMYNALATGTVPSQKIGGVIKVQVAWLKTAAGIVETA